MVENLKTESLIAQRINQDFINSSEVSVDTMEIDNVLIKSCKAAYSMYKQALEDKKGGNWRWEVSVEKFDFTRDWESEAQEAGVAIICWWFREDGWKILW